MAETDARVTNPELALLCRQFASLMKADVNILDIFETLRVQTNNAFLREVLNQVREDIEMGHTLATSFSRYPNTFSPFFITMIRKGELEGELGEVLEDLADHFERGVVDTPAARRGARGPVFDWEAAATAFQWIFIWLTALGAVCALGAGLVYYGTGADGVGIPGERLPNMLLLVGVVMLLGVLLFSRGRRRR